MTGIAMLCLVTATPTVSAHPGSISLFVNSDNQLYPLETFEFTQMQNFLDIEISADGPGFLVNFTSNGVIPGASLAVDVTQNLMFWDGVGLADTAATVEMRAPEFDNQGITNDSPVDAYDVTSSSGAMTGMDWGIYNGAPFWESHGINFLHPLVAPAGIYGVGVRVHSDRHASSEPFVVPLIYDPDNQLSPSGRSEWRGKTSSRYRGSYNR